MYKSKLSKVIVALLRRIAGVTRSGANRLMRAMLRSLMAMGRRANLPVAGFVLPTVTMVLLVVILLTIAITLRSFDRANTARNVRVNQQVLAAATPALDRAKAKIQFMLWEDPQRPTGTPSDPELYARMANANTAVGATDLYSFGDEERLILRADLNNDNKADTAAEPKNPPISSTGVENEAINTAWRYPVDTNNDGFFDTFTLYGIFFRTPKRNDLGDFTRARKSLEARTPPTSANSVNPDCVQGGGTVASLVGDSGWYRIDGQLKKSFFVDTVNVPIKQEDIANLSEPSKYKPFPGTASTSALEYQQDQSRIPLANNAVVYEDDLDISPGPLFNLNGRIFTNSNLLVTNLNGKDRTRLYQVSSPDSCFYEQENSKIVVGGNVVNGWSGNNTDTKQINPVGVHLFKKASSLTGDRNGAMLGAAKTISDADGAESTSIDSLKVMYNNAAYADRLSALVAAQMGPPLPGTTKPDPNPLPSDPFVVQNKPTTQTREQALEEYFKQMLRKVPFAETDLVLPDPLLNRGTQPDDLRPAKNTWIIPDDNQTGISVLPSLQKGQLETTTPEEGQPIIPEEKLLGDRVIAGNNLPEKRWENNKFTSEVDTITPGKWNSTDTSGIRKRSPQVTKLADVGATDRDGFWEGKAAEIPKNPLDGIGGLRVITSAGVYERTNSFLPPPTWINPLDGKLLGNGAADAYNDPTTTDVTETYPVVWPDSMPMSPLGLGSQVYDNSAGGDYAVNKWKPLPATLTASGAGIIDPRTPQYAKGDLRMRATAVYHYKEKGGYNPNVKPINYDDVRPFACVSSYYDPSTASTARNLSTLPDVSGQNTTLNPPELGTPGTFGVGSNNGVVYSPPLDQTKISAAFDKTTSLLSTTPPELGVQANYVFPDGRFANEPLRNALKKPPGERKLADKAAIDSTMCALEIIATAPKPFSSDIPNGAIQEVAFLNAREVKAIDRDDPTTIVNEAFTLSSPLTTIDTAKPANLTGNYNQPIEEREPLEIRATQIDLNKLRSNSIAGEPLLPYSGIIYASRDDALPDRSNRNSDEIISAKLSSTDSRLDPTRKPNAILLINGSKLARDPSLPPTVANVVMEKGLTLASNLPVYIKDQFNLHTQHEFKAPSQAEFKTDADWAKFYKRVKGDLNKDFACRPDDPRLSECNTGDDWRPANILADAITLLSKNYRFGFRNEGDFDLRNNAGAAAVLPRRQQGFYNNNFVTNGLSSGAFLANGNLKESTDPITVTDASYVNLTPQPLWSSYFNNFVTPVQRRGPFPKYVMEVCTKLPVSACTDSDWYVNPALATDPPTAAGKATIGSYTAAAYPAGTTEIPPTKELQRFPRRVAFQRNITPPFDLQDLNDPKPLGIIGNTIASGLGSKGTNALWFAANSGGDVTYDDTNLPYRVNAKNTDPGTTDGSKVPLPILAAQSTTPPPAVTLPPARYNYNGSQPLLMPVPQLMGGTTSTPNTPRGTESVDLKTGWIPLPTDTTFNLIVGANDTPSRTLNLTSGDSNGGLQNLPRFLELWRRGTLSQSVTNIQGSFIQLDRSKFNTAPYQPTLPSDYTKDLPDKLTTLFAQSTSPTTAATALAGTDSKITEYNISGGLVPYFTPPTRNWGYDVGLLSQPPDLFTQKFTTPPSRKTPDEYFREVPRNDDWVTTLMCGVLEKTPAIKATQTIKSTDCPT
ncbi:hormogonium polysaccharide biosynthesis protein HpsA [Tychonema sp. BBK16]|uniref:hormogonium polysaccharide biosynthesis protein HpsA n=1 Tax=Tychonema sp. BBK16 TaxID=2699888 RepID=UPI001F30580B|nr:hormogonium polysaccharide biosynthesis protein HpsA [Tychonema sp. BBK16]MCF6374726.1 hormogonium polysaccharide biosynthesis protein HpsA [Tychonema sp. BBK16]